METSESGFETKAAALTWGRDQEARIREGRWTDPNAGKVTVGEWVDRWMALQDVGLSTTGYRDYMIRRFIRPAWGDSALNSLTTEEITRWENALPSWEGISPRTARANPHPARHHPRRRRDHPAAADPVQPCTQAS